MSRLTKEPAFCSVASTSQEGLEEETPTSATNKTLKVTLLSSEWKSTKGGLSTISRELAIQLAKHPDVEVSVYLPQCSEEDKKIAASLNVKIIEAEELPGYEAVDWLASVPDNHGMDWIIGHGVHLGRQVPLIKRHNHLCKWIQIVHTAPEELGMYKTYTDAISKGEKKHQAEVKLCEMADQVVAVGPKLADAYSRSLRPCQKDQEVITLTPGIFTEFSEVKQAAEERNTFVVLVFGRGDSEDFELKGYDIAAKAIAELNDMSCHLMFVGAPSGKEEEVKEKLLAYGISPAQLTVRCFDESREGLAKLLCEVDLAIMPSRTEGFGLTALEALSAGLPVLVSGNSGLGEAFKKVATGSYWIVASEEPKDWAKAISAVQEKDRDVRLEECKMLRKKYGAKYSWQKQCCSLVETMQKISFGPTRIRLQPSVLSIRPLPSGTKALNRKRLLTHDDKGASERGTSTTFPLKQRRLSLDSDTGHVLSVFLRILKAEYNRRSLLKPLPWENTFKLPLEDVYTRLSIVSRRKSDFKLESGEVNMYDIFKTVNKGKDAMVVVEGSSEVNMYDIFKTLNKGEDAMVLVEGSPGIGKTTFCLKISYDWTNEKIPNGFCFPVFELVLLLKCRDIHGDIMEAISEQLLPEDTDEKIMKEIMDYIKDIHNQEKVLIILDGLDELPKTAETHVDKLLYRRILPFCYVLATSRQERGIVVRQKVDFDILLQIQGFTKQDAFEYIRKHFSHSGSNNLSEGERLIEAIQENPFLHALPNNPLNLLLLCVVFEDYQGELPSFRSELYQIIIRCLLRKYCARHNLEVPGDDQALEKQFEDSLLVLGELAWRCLQQDRFSFREEELAKFESTIEDLAARKLGLVSKEASVKKLNPQYEYHFFHKTFQEYLAATYLAHKLLKEGVNVFREFKLDFKEHVPDEYRQVFLFVSGILGNEASILFKQIGETLASEGWDWLECSEEEATFFTESFIESRNAEQMAMTLCSLIPFLLTVEIKLSGAEGEDFEETANILIVAEACRNFSQLQHPVHLTIEVKDSDDSLYYEMVAQFLVSCPKLQTFSLRNFGLEDSFTALFKGLSGNSSISSFTFRDVFTMYSDLAVAFGESLVANKTLTTVTLELTNEFSDDWASALERGLSADTPFTSVVFKIYGSLFAKAIGALKRVLSNRSLTSLTLIIYGEMQDSLATSVSQALAAESIFKSLTLIIYGKVSYSGAVSLERGFLENNALSSLEVKVFGELPDNWVTVAEKVRETKKTKMSVAFYPNITGAISKVQMTRLWPSFELQSLTLNLWGELSCSGADTLCNVLITSSMSCVTLNIHGKLTDNVAECLVSHLKPCKTLSSLSINIWGELTRGGNSALQELVCNRKYSVALNVCNVASDLWIGKDHNTSLTTLSLTINPSGDWIRALGERLANNTSLTTLNLTINNDIALSKDMAHALGDHLAKTSSLTTLNLTINNCTDLSEDWAHALGDGLAKNTSLTTLNLTINNCIGLSEDWTRGLGDGLAKNTSLTTLSLTVNNYSDLRGDWAHGLGDGLAKNTSLTTLSLTMNYYSYLFEDWAYGLGHGLAKNTSLTTLSLTVNYFSGILIGAWAFLLGDVLAKNSSLTTLSFTLNDYTDLSYDWAWYLGLGRSKSLTVVNVTVTTCIKMSEAWLCGLCNSLAESNTITALNVTFNDLSGTSEGLELDLGKHFAGCKLSPSVNLTVGLYGDAVVS